MMHPEMTDQEDELVNWYREVYESLFPIYQIPRAGNEAQDLQRLIVQVSLENRAICKEIAELKDAMRASKKAKKKRKA